MQKYYLFDSGIVNQAENAELLQGKVEKLLTDAKWVSQYSWTPESGLPDWEHHISILYPSVEYDERNGKYRLWYQAYFRDSLVDDYRWTEHLIDRENSKNVALGEFVNTAKGVIYKGRDALCYMESEDGIHWVRPNLGEFYYKTRSGEIIGTNIVYVGMHGIGVKKNENPDPNEPAYLMAGRTWESGSLDSEGEPIGVAISYSEDGIHWEEPITIKCAYDCAPDLYCVRADTYNHLFWSTELGKYVAISRGYTKEEPRVRVVAYMENTDALGSIRELLKAKRDGGEQYWEATSKYWTCPETVLDDHVTLDAQPYSMPVTHVADGCYIGVVSIVNFDPHGRGVYNSVHAELAWSPEGKRWQYMDQGNPFIENAREFSLEPGNDYGMIYCAAPVSVGGKTKIFYSATPELHYVEYDDIPAHIRKVVDEKIPKAKKLQTFTRTSALNIAQIEKDRYASLYAEDGSITTQRFEVLGKRLAVTADVQDDGCLKIEVLDANGAVIDGYEADRFTAVTTNVTEKAVFWGDKDLSALEGMTVSFRILLKNAGLYMIGGEIKREEVRD